MDKEISLKIKKLLKLRGMNQNELASKTEISKSAISKYVNGAREPSGSNLIKIANALDTTTDYLLGYKDGNSYSDFEEIRELIVRNLPSMSKEERVSLIELIINME